MNNAYTPETKKSPVTPKAPLYCGLIDPPAAAKAQGVSARQIISIVGLYNRDTNGFEIKTIFGTTDFCAVIERQTEEKKQRLGNDFDGNYLYSCAQQGFFSCTSPKQANQEWALLCCWMDSVEKDGQSQFLYHHAFVVAGANGFFNINNPTMAWDSPRDIPVTIENAKSETYQKVLNAFYPEEEEPVWKISSWHPSVVKKRERAARMANSLETSIFGIAPKEKKPEIRRAETRIDNRTKQIINNVLRSEYGIEVYVDKETGLVKVRESVRQASRKSADTEMAHAFASAGVA